MLMGQTGIAGFVLGAGAAAPIQFVGAIESAMASSGTGTESFSYPTGTQDGDYVIVIAALDINKSWGTDPMITDSGWSQITQNNGGGVRPAIYAFDHFVDGDTAVNLQQDGANAYPFIIAVFRNVDNSTGINAGGMDITVTGDGNGSGQADPPVSNTIITDNVTLVAFCSHERVDAGEALASPWVNFSSTAAGCHVGFSYKPLVSNVSGTENPTAMTNGTSGTWRAYTGALRPKYPNAT